MVERNLETARPISGLCSAIQLHDDLRCSRPVFQAFEPHPEMRWCYAKPEECFRKKMTEEIENTNMWDHLDLITFEFSGGSSHTFLPPVFKRETVHVWFVGQQMRGKRSVLVEWDIPQDPGDTFDDESIRRNNQRFFFWRTIWPLALDFRNTLHRIETLSFRKKRFSFGCGHGLFGI